MSFMLLRKYSYNTEDDFLLSDAFYLSINRCVYSQVESFKILSQKN